jgi:hypothetical protein
LPDLRKFCGKNLATLMPARLEQCIELNDYMMMCLFVPVLELLWWFKLIMTFKSNSGLVFETEMYKLEVDNPCTYIYTIALLVTLFNTFLILGEQSYPFTDWYLSKYSDCIFYISSARFEPGTYKTPSWQWVLHVPQSPDFYSLYQGITHVLRREGAFYLWITHILWREGAFYLCWAAAVAHIRY